MKQDNYINQLKKVNRVDAPPFLLTRIRAAIHARQTEQTPAAWKWVGAAAVSLLLLLNMLALRDIRPADKNPAASSLAIVYHLDSSSQLYDE